MTCLVTSVPFDQQNQLWRITRHSCAPLAPQPHHTAPGNDAHHHEQRDIAGRSTYEIYLPRSSSCQTNVALTFLLAFYLLVYDPASNPSFNLLPDYRRRRSSDLRLSSLLKFASLQLLETSVTHYMPKDSPGLTVISIPLKTLQIYLPFT